MLKRVKLQQGITLIELMMGLAVGLVLTFGMVLFYSNISRISNDTLRTTRLEYELQTAMRMIATDLRRAGFSAGASGLIGSNIVNPFMVTNVSDIMIPRSDCILFTYDIDMNGALTPIGTAASDDRFAYRLNNQTIQIRPTTDNQFSCDASTWENLTNPNIIEITSLVFSLTQDSEVLDPADPTGATITVRDVNITITGRLVSDNSISRTISSQVRIRNDRFQP